MYTREPDLIFCRCGGTMYEDPTPTEGALERGPRPRRFYCFLCGRDRFVKASELVTK